MGTPTPGFPKIYQPAVNYYVHFPTADGAIVYVLTGHVDINIRGQATGLNFFRTSFFIEVPIPDLPAGKGLRLTHWAPFVTLNSISNDGAAENAGWAVDDFSIQSTTLAISNVMVNVNVAVRDIDGYILRCGYQVTLSGTLAPRV